jgi:hypothetical protein
MRTCVHACRFLADYIAARELFRRVFTRNPFKGLALLLHFTFAFANTRKMAQLAAFRIPNIENEPNVRDCSTTLICQRMVT